MQQPPSDSHISAENALGIAVPELHSAPVFYPAGTRLIWISGAGEIDSIDCGEAALRLRASVPVICHRQWSEARAGTEIEACLDVMELFAFVRPARFCLPTPRGLAAQLSLPMPSEAEDMADAIAAVRAAVRAAKDLCIAGPSSETSSAVRCRRLLHLIDDSVAKLLFVLLTFFFVF